MKQLRLLILLMLPLLMIGCEEPTPNPEPDLQDVYAVRSDLLLINAPKIVPSGLDLPGFPPLLLIRQASASDPLPRGIADLAADRNNLLDPRKLDQPNFEGTVYKPLFERTLTDLFGTPREPKIEPLSSAVAEAITELKLDPPTLADGFVVYRMYCVTCHGPTGGGDGANGRWLVPHPRDYRQGVFKFISADPARQKQPGKPRRADLRHAIIHGMDGAGMPSFAHLSEQQIDDVISYVTHLSIRGEVEYQTMKDALDEINLPLPLPEEAEDAGFKDEIEMTMHAQLELIAPAWLDANRYPVEPRPDPYVTEQQQLDAAAAGYAIFNNAEVGTCTKCHLNYGKNALLNYDIWGTIARPRNLLTGTLRGGRTPDDLYNRLIVGIPGSGMPSFAEALKPTEDQQTRGHDPMWQLVHFLRALPVPEKRRILERDYGASFD